MKLLKTKKKKVWHSACDGLYDYKEKETVYIVEMSEQEYFKAQNQIILSREDYGKLMDMLHNPPEPNDNLKNLFTNNKKIIKPIKVYSDPSPEDIYKNINLEAFKEYKFKTGTYAGPCSVKIDKNGNPELDIDAGPCMVQVDENGNPIVNTIANSNKETK